MRLSDDKLAALTDIMEQSPDGRLHPPDVVEKARDKSHPLHNDFDWNDTSAAQKHREWQARQLIRYAVRILPTPDGDARTVKVFSRLHGEQGYRSTAVLLEDRDLRERLLETALAELLRFRKKYADIEELAEIFRAIDDVAA